MFCWLLRCQRACNGFAALGVPSEARNKLFAASSHNPAKERNETMDDFFRKRGDPKSSKNAVQYDGKNIDADQLPPDYPALLSLLGSLTALMLQSRVASWIALILLLHSATTLRYRLADWKLLMCVVVFAAISFFSNYMAPEHIRPFISLKVS